jgi:glucose-6-phosphate isomerase
LTITLPVVDAGSLGQLFFLLETATAVAGELFDVDAFDQPGVELGKQAAYALMGRADATISVEQIETGAGGDERYVLK